MLIELSRRRKERRRSTPFLAEHQVDGGYEWGVGVGLGVWGWPEDNTAKIFKEGSYQFISLGGP